MANPPTSFSDRAASVGQLGVTLSIRSTITAIWILLSAMTTTVDRVAASDDPPLKCQTSLSQQLLKNKPIYKLNPDLQAASQQLDILRNRPQPSPVYMGVSQPLHNVIQVTARPHKDKNGIVARCGNSTLFATSIGLPAKGYYALVIAGDNAAIKNVTVVNSSLKPISTSFTQPADKSSSVVAVARGLVGPISVVVIEASGSVRRFGISLTEIIPIDWPADPQALIPGVWKAVTANDAARSVVGPMGINDASIPANFLDYECMKNHDLFDRFPSDLRSHVNAIGLLDAFVRENGKVAEGYCTATLVVFDRDPLKRSFVLTANHCFVGDQKRDAQPGDIISATVYWDYRNPQCTKGPPARWNWADIYALPSTTLTLARATAISDAAILSPTTPPVGRTPLPAGGTPDYIANNVFRMRFHHADIRPLMGSEPFWEFQSEPGFPNPGYSGACEAVLPAQNFFYSMWIIHSQSSAVANGSSGSADIDQRGHVVGQLWGWCNGAPIQPGPFSNFDVDGKIERSLDNLGLP